MRIIKDQNSELLQEKKYTHIIRDESKAAAYYEMKKTAAAAAATTTMHRSRLFLSADMFACA